MKSYLVIILFVNILLSCNRDFYCECYGKRGCRTVYVVQNTHPETVVERRRYCPTVNFEKDTGFIAYLNGLHKKYDSLSLITGLQYSYAISDSFGLDTTRNVGSAATNTYRAQGFQCKCRD